MLARWGFNKQKITRRIYQHSCPHPLGNNRTIVSSAATQDAVDIFDRKSKQAQRERAAYLRDDGKEDPLLAEVSERLLDRLEDMNKKFPVAAVLGGAAESVVNRLQNSRAGIREVHYFDASEAMLRRVRKVSDGPGAAKLFTCLADDEFPPLKPGSFDVIISCLGLHWVNDVPGVMTQCRKALKPDGLFLAALWGGLTLQELRIACMTAEERLEHGVSQRVSPLVQVRDAGNLLTRAGLTIPSVDADEIIVHYDTPNQLVQHIREMGESNAVTIRRPIMRQKTWEAVGEAYRSTLTQEEQARGSLPATYQAIYMTGWSPHARQQRAMERGSATVSFQDLDDYVQRGGKPDEK